MSDLAALLLILETRLAVADPADAGLVDLIADDFLEFGASGRTWDRAAIIEMLAGAGPRQLRLADFAVDEIAPGVALVTYTTRDDVGEDSRQRRSRRSSLWLLRDGRWQIRFHQGTLAPLLA